MAKAKGRVAWISQYAAGVGSGLERAEAYLDRFDFSCNQKMNRSLAFDLATAAFISRHEDALFLGRPGTGRSHLAQAIGLAAIERG